MNRPSLVSRSKFSVSDLTVTPRSRSSPDGGQHVRGRAAPPVGLPEHQGVAGLQGGQGAAELRPLHAVPAGFLLGEQLVISMRVQGIQLQLGVLVSRGDPAGNVYLPGHQPHAR